MYEVGKEGKWKKVEEGWLKKTQGAKGTLYGIKIGTEVVVRNDNTSTDISIIRAVLYVSLDTSKLSRNISL